MGSEKHTTSLRMDAYYYGFEPTGVELVDRMLSAVACAGKAYHHTEDWEEQTEPYEAVFRGQNPIEWIQHAAEDAAARIRELKGSTPDMTTDQRSPHVQIEIVAAHDSSWRRELRDRFACTALLAITQGDHVDGQGDPERHAALAYCYADAMLAERARGEHA